MQREDGKLIINVFFNLGFYSVSALYVIKNCYWPKRFLDLTFAFQLIPGASKYLRLVH